jgi:hypothetical protein
MNPEQMIGRLERLEDVKNPALKLSIRENVFGSQPDPIPVTRQLPENHLAFLL